MTVTTAPLRIGTRTSLLARTQTDQVAHALAEFLDHPLEIVLIRTEGDMRLGPLAQLGGTGVFVAALREALLTGYCDLAVHSLKDLPTTPLPELTMVVPPRADPRDALCSAGGLTLNELPDAARIGTGSPRRAAQLLAVRSDLRIENIRGNVDTRLHRVYGPHADLDAVVLAVAGLDRIGCRDAIAEIFAPDVMCPAPGQGALAVEARAGSEPFLAQALQAIEHLPTRLAVMAERTVLRRLDVGCSAPVGAYATVIDASISLTSVVVSEDGGQRISHTQSAPLPPGAEHSERAAIQLGEQVATELLNRGATDLGAGR